MIRSYLDWLIAVPWAKRSEERLDPVYAREVLDADHYGLEDVKDRIVEYLAVRKLRQERGIEEDKKSGAILTLIEVLPVPGGPIRVRIAPDFLSSSIPRCPRRAHRQLDDAVLDVLEPVAIGVENLARVGGIEDVPRSASPSGTRDPPSRRSGSSTPRRLLAVRSSRPKFAIGCSPHLVRRIPVDLRPVLVDDRGVVLAQLLADRLHLATQDVLAAAASGR